MNARPCLLLAVAVALFTATAQADIEGRVVAVSDGDTIKVLDADKVLYKIRLAGIDAPEKAQAFGMASRDHLASMVAGKVVRVEASKTDRYGRLLGKVWVQPQDCPGCARTLNVNHAQILAGMAWWYQYYAHEQPQQDRERYKSALAEARAGKRGLWSEAGAIPPWAWRRGQRTPAMPAPAASFQCGAKRYCREMASCAEATFYLRQCGLSSLDRNQDGVPCEPICY